MGLKTLSNSIHPGTEVVWQPNEGSQTFFVRSPFWEALVDGNRGGGKSDALLMAFAQHVGQGWGRSWRGVIFRKQHKNLDELVTKGKRFFYAAFPDCRFLESQAQFKFVWSTGEELLLRTLERDDDYENYKGHEYPYIAFDELTTWPTSHLYDTMKACSRSSVPSMPRMYRATTNPYGAGHCVPFGEVLTPDRGWADIKEMKAGDAIISVDKHGAAHETRTSDVVRMNYHGDMMYREGRGLSMAFTPEHRLPKVGGNRQNTGNTRTGRKQDFTLTPFKDLPGQAIIQRAATSWRGEPLESFTVREVQGRKTKLSQPRTLKGEDYAAFMGWFLSEGFTVDRDKAFGIAQSKPQQRARLKRLLDQCDFEARWSETGAMVYAATWWEYLRRFGLCRAKRVPARIKRATTPALRAFFDSAMDGDGHWTGDRSGQYYTTSKQLADDVAEIAVKLGYSVYISSRQRENRDGLSYAVNFCPKTTIQLNTGNHLYGVKTKSHNVNVQRRPFAGEVYCLTVPETETFFVRQNGCVWLSGNSWVKAYWYDPAPGYDPTGIFIRNKRSGQIRARYTSDLMENQRLLDATPEYLEQLDGIQNEALRQAWRFGNWDIMVGGFWDGVWDPDKHIVKPFTPPVSWKHWRAMDWGYAKPYSIGWYAKSPEGQVVRYRELYGWGGKEDVGSRESASTVAQRVMQLDHFERKIGCRFSLNPADSQIWAGEGHEKTLADYFREVGVAWMKAAKGKDSRVNGANAVREALEMRIPVSPERGGGEVPGFVVTRDCKHFLRTFPVLMPDEDNWEDVDTDMEDHAYDEVRYSLFSRHKVVGRKPEKQDARLYTEIELPRPRMKQESPYGKRLRAGHR